MSNRLPELGDRNTLSESRHTVLLVGGLTEGVDTFQGFKQALEAEGLGPHSFNYTHKPAADLDCPGQLRYQTSKVGQLVDEIRSNTPGGTKTTLVAHSMGGPIALRAALVCHDKVDRVILSNATGLFPDSALRLAARFSIELFGRKLPTLTKYARRQNKAGASELIHHPVANIGDILDIGHTDNQTVLRQVELLKELGIPTDVLLSHRDFGFPWRRIKNHLDLEHKDPSTQIKTLKNLPFNSLSMYYAAKIGRRGKARKHRLAGRWAGHDQPVIYPQYAARLIAQLLKPEDINRYPKINKRDSRT